MSWRGFRCHFAAAAALALGLASAQLAISVPSASAADLNQAYPESPYDDPRYSDMYRIPPPAPRYAVPAPEGYGRDDRDPRMRDRDGYLRPMQPQRSYGHNGGYRDDDGLADGRQFDGRFAEDAAGCLPSRVVRGQLERRGWFEFHDVDARSGVVHMRARRGDGRLFDLSLDRCNGQLLEARPVERRAAQADDWHSRPPPPGSATPPGPYPPGY